MIYIRNALHNLKVTGRSFDKREYIIDGNNLAANSQQPLRFELFFMPLSTKYQVICYQHNRQNHSSQNT